jgi:hypothetical protein
MIIGMIKAHPTENRMAHDEPPRARWREWLADTVEGV